MSVRRSFFTKLYYLKACILYYARVKYEGVLTKMSEAGRPLTVPKEFLSPPGDWNPTLLLFLSALAIVAISFAGYWYGDWPDWCCFSLNVLALHMAGTVIHDASHNAAHRDRAVNAILGHGSALMLGFAFPVFTRVHMQHHAHVNDPDNDPDHYVSTGGPLWLIAARFFTTKFSFLSANCGANTNCGNGFSAVCLSLEWFIPLLNATI